jgi:hypothetical protein
MIFLNQRDFPRKFLVLTELFAWSYVVDVVLKHFKIECKPILTIIGILFLPAVVVDSRVGQQSWTAEVDWDEKAKKTSHWFNTFYFCFMYFKSKYFSFQLSVNKFPGLNSMLKECTIDLKQYYFVLYMLDCLLLHNFQPNLVYTQSCKRMC